MQWSKQQLEAINTIDKNVTVFASAGAGKTTLLIERLTKRIRDEHLSVLQICAMTFTEAAASEMKKRLAQSLANSDDPFLKQQLTLLPQAMISTIDSICATIVKNYGARLAMDPLMSSTILDEAVLHQLRDQAFEQLFAQELGTSQFTALYEHFTTRINDFSALREAITVLADKAYEHPDPESFYTQILASYQAQSIAELSPIQQSFYWRLMTQTFTTLRSRTNDVIAAYDLDQPDKPEQLEQFMAFSQCLQDCLAAIKAHDESFVSHFQQSYSFQLKSVRNAPNYNAAKKELFKKVNSLMADFFPLPVFFKRQNEMADVVATLIQYAKTYRHLYQEAKTQAKGIDFSDLEHLALQLLQDQDGAVAQLMKERFAEIMVDEYQDTSPLQEAIIQCLSRPDNVFRVGDVKQSIYGFRGAKPDLMRLLSDQDSNESISLYLDQNYRSKANIVYFTNFLFQRLMNIDGLKDHYDTRDTVSLGRMEQQTDSLPVQIHLIDQPEQDEDRGSKVSNSQLKAIHIANQMIAYHNQGHPWRTMAVLVRTHQVKRDLKKAFDDAGIPYFIGDPQGFIASDIVQDMLNLLQLSLNSEDYFLYASLSSVFFNYDDDSLSALHLYEGSAWTALKALHPIDYQELSTLLSELRSSSIIESLSTLTRFHNVYEDQCNQTQRTNVDFLISKANTYALQGNDSVFGFLNYLSQLQEAKVEQPVPVSSDDDVVKVMTIHQSKGLQFPIIFFWSSNRRNVIDTTKPTMIDLDLGLGLYAIDPVQHTRHTTLQRILCEYKARWDDLEEHIRLLYVALTRAQNEMIIVDVVPNNELSQLSDDLIFSSAGSTSLMIGALNVSDDSYSLLHFEPDEALKIDLKAHPTHAPFDRYANTSNTQRIRPSHEIAEESDLHLNFSDNLKKSLDTGTRMHGVMEHIPSDGWTNDALIEAYPDLSARQRDTVLTYQNDPFTQELLQQTIHREYSFLVNLNQQPVFGIIDFLAMTKDTVTLVDFKTDIGVSGDELRARHQPQINLYLKALKVLFPHHQAKAYLYSFALHQYIEMH